MTMTVEPNEERPLGRTVACDPQNPSFVKTLNAAGELETILADTGVGCHPLEVTALLQLLTSHDEHHKNMDHTDSWRSLSNSYRAAVRDCILKWKDQASSDHDMENCLQYTEKIYETMHLSEIFLPLISENWEHSDPYSKPGYVTAATVKWLRLHSIPEYFQSSDIEDMLASEIPESHPIYWKLLYTELFRGQLDRARDLLQHHQAYQAAQALVGNDNASDRRLAKSMMDGFQMMELILKYAPLPGGRNSDKDDGFEEYEEDMDEVYEDSNSLRMATTDYMQWEANSSGLYSHQSALSKHRNWQEYVRKIREAMPLASHIPEIDTVLAILSGDFHSIEFGGWAQQLCAELLYNSPNIRPRDVPNRARRLMHDFNDVDAPVISIMEGAADTAMANLQIYGANSGAALPSTVVRCLFGSWSHSHRSVFKMSLLFSLFSESGVISPPPKQKAEALCNSASHIVSSLAESDHDLGVQQAVRLLVPYAVKESDPEYVSSIANFLEHYSPSEDHHARTMVSMCEPLLDLKSIQVLDGCASFLLYRYNHYMKGGAAGRAALILADGIELESKVLPGGVRGACSQALAIYCTKAATTLLNCASDPNGDSQLDERVKIDAESVVSALSDTKCVAMSEVMTLSVVLALFEAVASSDEDGIGKHIVTCFQTNADGICLAPMTLHQPLMELFMKHVERSRTSVNSPPIALGKAHLLCQQAVGHTDRVDPRMYRSFLTAMAQDFCAENAKLKPTHVELAVPSVPNFDYLDVEAEEREVAKLVDSFF